MDHLNELEREENQAYYSYLMAQKEYKGGLCSYSALKAAREYWENLCDATQDE